MASKRYSGVAEDVTPYEAQVGDDTYRFTRRPSAKVQIAFINALRKRDDIDEAALADVFQQAAIGMLPADANGQVDRLMEAVDLEVLSEILNDAIETVTARPTTESPDSSPPATATTSATGSPEPASVPATSES